MGWCSCWRAIPRSSSVAVRLSTRSSAQRCRSIAPQLLNMPASAFFVALIRLKRMGCTSAGPAQLAGQLRRSIHAAQHQRLPAMQQPAGQPGRVHVRLQCIVRPETVCAPDAYPCWPESHSSRGKSSRLGTAAAWDLHSTTSHSPRFTSQWCARPSPLSRSCLHQGLPIGVAEVSAQGTAAQPGQLPGAPWLCILPSCA